MWKIWDILKDKDFWKRSWLVSGGLFTISTVLITFLDSLANYKLHVLLGAVLLSVLYVFISFVRTIMLRKMTLHIDGSEVEIKKGDIFTYPEEVCKVIAFNEYFDTVADDIIIPQSTLNGKYLNRFYVNEDELADLDQRMIEDKRMDSKIVARKVKRRLGGKSTKYKLGSIFEDRDFLLVAFSKFNDDNQANLKLHEYALCLINFWNELNNYYRSREVVIPLLGSGITKHENFDATPHELLEIMLWTFKISKVKFKEPSKITILLYGDHHKEINFYHLKAFEKKRI